MSEDFIEDDFNLTGLSSLVPFYKEALDMVLDVEPTDADLKVPDVSIVESSAELLYGLVHQRYILTRSGLVSMAAKFDEGHFGYCPRVYCSNARVLPSGRSDMPGVDTVKLFCPSCLDLYTPPSSRFTGVDGSFFGTTFAHLLLHVQKDLADHADSSRLIDNLHAPPKNRVYVPKIYGFRVSERAKSGPRMAWLRQKPKHPSEVGRSILAHPLSDHADRILLQLDKVDGRGRWRELAEDEDEEEDDSDEESSGSEEEEDEQQQQQQAGGQGTAKMSSNKSRSAKKGEAGRVEGPLFEDDVKGEQTKSLVFSTEREERLWSNPDCSA